MFDIINLETELKNPTEYRIIKTLSETAILNPAADMRQLARKTLHLRYSGQIQKIYLSGNKLMLDSLLLDQISQIKVLKKFYVSEVQNNLTYVPYDLNLN